jgi:hypothetical protein
MLVVPPNSKCRARAQAQHPESSALSESDTLILGGEPSDDSINLLKLNAEDICNLFDFGMSGLSEFVENRTSPCQYQEH